jgi:hypothetical protein
VRIKEYDKRVKIKVALFQYWLILQCISSVGPDFATCNKKYFQEYHPPPFTNG